jgi:hypothetical protein
MKYEGDTKEIRSVAEGGGVENYVRFKTLFTLNMITTPNNQQNFFFYAIKAIIPLIAI